MIQDPRPRPQNPRPQKPVPQKPGLQNQRPQKPGHQTLQKAWHKKTEFQKSGTAYVFVLISDFA